jgi:hypothetical protein
MFWPWEVVERDHEIQNPVSPEKTGCSVSTCALPARAASWKLGDLRRSQDLSSVPSRMGAA